MSLNIPRYLYPLKGIRKSEVGPGGYSTRRNKEDSPYGIFIQYIDEEAFPWEFEFDCEKGLEYESLWKRAEGPLHALLWESDNARERARRSLETLNDEIREIGPVPQEGLLEIRNWYNAGLQLEKAVRDFHIYSSTARFEDVRDFIWERIITMNYPHQWRVKREDFLHRIEATAQNFARQQGDLDTEDAIFQEWQLENPPERPGSSPLPSYHTNNPNTEAMQRFDAPLPG
ncbi:hypothetical protein EYZ11_008374 [Aspergillus tanneri]|uniref:Uncharacterized protein n=1 Tax=Aspergillus tanneri TaxID=1220188 RepID=A0A4S3JAL4_9EURO|nr:hypothetical protein EYZ11_008374 [Aspergillus tanneri]